MGRRKRELAELEVLARRVWGDAYYEQHMRAKRSRWSRVQAAVGIGVGVPMLLTASLLSLFATAASAHTSTIHITCPAVEFVYADFPAMTETTSHEVVSIDGVEIAQRDFTFVGSTGSDTIAISVASGTHTVEATAAWTFDGAPRGSASDSQELSKCSSTSTTSAPEHTTTTIGS
ncbi:MAG: hypothetical protein QOE62_1409, partial [Actinomycetota bacterium]|nr:hypothetical protein [Actinomycetota bacterium]